MNTATLRVIPHLWFDQEAAEAAKLKAFLSMKKLDLALLEQAYNE